MIATKREVYLLILILAAGMAGSFFLGSWTTTNNTRVISQQIYDQGFTAGEVSGLNKMQTQCDSEVRAIASNCKLWEHPGLRFGNVNLTEGQ
jgi:hypothetical protein